MKFELVAAVTVVVVAFDPSILITAFTNSWPTVAVATSDALFASESSDDDAVFGMFGSRPVAIDNGRLLLLLPLLFASTAGVKRTVSDLKLPLFL